MFKTNRVLLRIIYSHLLAGVLLTAVLLAVVSSVLSTRIERTQATAAQSLLRQTYQTTSVLLSDTYDDFYALWARDDLIREALSPTGVAPAQASELGTMLAEAVRRDEIVHSVQLINRDTGLVYSDQTPLPTDFSNADDPGAIALLRDFALNFDDWRDEVFFPRVLAPRAGSEAETGLLSVIFASHAADGAIHSGIVVNIDRARLARLVTPAALPGQLLMVSPTGHLIANLSGATADIGSDPSVSPAADNDMALQRIIAASAEDGSLTAQFQGEQTFIVYHKASQLGFIFIRTLPNRLLLAESSDTNRVVVFLFVVAMLISLAISVLSIWMIYHPLNRLVRRMRDIVRPSEQTQADEYAFLQAATTALYEQNRRSALVRVFFGQADAAVLDSLQFHHTVFLVLALAPDQAGLASAMFMERLRQLAESFPGWQAAVTAPDCVSVLLNGDGFDEAVLERIYSQIKDLQQAACQQLQQCVVVGIGTAVTEAGSIRTSHRQALAALQQALAQGNGQLALYHEPDAFRGSASQNRPAITQRIEDYANAHLGEQDLTPESIAEHIGLSLGYMRQLFRSEHGESVNDYILGRRIAQAQILLATTDLTAKQIGAQVGFPDSRYFYTVFRKQTGVTTEAYRRHVRTDDARKAKEPDDGRGDRSDRV